MHRPVFLVGNGARFADSGRLLNMGIPILVSWQAADLFDSDHPLVFGRPGVYGQRCANKVLYNADHIISLGCRMFLWTIGYVPLPGKVTYVDIDPDEVDRFEDGVCMDVGKFIDTMRIKPQMPWLDQCRKWKKMYPWIEHTDTEYINSYRFIEKMIPYLRYDEVIVTEMGAALCSAFQGLPIKPPQRLMTSGGLGEMGCGLPAAIGASFARNKGQVLCLNTDGGMMINLQELQTIVHNKLPIKIVVFSNDGYAMIRGTQDNFKMQYAGVNKDSGVSCPNFRWVAQSFGIMSGEVRTWADFDRIMPMFMAANEPCLIEVHIDPKQKYYPKLQPIKNADGSITSPEFENLT